MITFAKPTPLKAALKIALFGPAGGGKTFTSLLIAEGLAQHTGKRIACCDTEQGTAFYSQEVPARHIHPSAFDFDVLHSRSITEVLAAIRTIDPSKYGVIVIDSITHLWDACKAAYSGKVNRNGAIPFQAWTAIKKPYRELMHRLLSLPIHVLICGRQGVDYGEDETTGELTNLGYKMRAEGETAYEPDLLLRMEQHRSSARSRRYRWRTSKRTGPGSWRARRSPGRRSRIWPSRCWGFSARRRSLPQARTRSGCKMRTPWIARRPNAGGDQSSWRRRTRRASRPRIRASQLQAIGRELTPGIKTHFTAKDLERVRKAFATRLAQLQSALVAEANGAVPA